MKIKIEIDCNNASLVNDEETVSELLQELARKIDDEPLEILQNEKVLDKNGNTVLWMTVERN